MAELGPILVTGGTGQLAGALAAAARGRPLLLVGRPAFDFDRPETIAAAVTQVRPSLVVNTAAYTAVDAAETDRDAAYRANRDGPALLAAACAEADIPLIHVSTDYVFDGRKGAPYVETDATAPQGVYGASKRAGEQAVLAAQPRSIVLRTSWVHAATGRNFVRTMISAARKTSSLRVVADQVGCPTSADDLADAILAIDDRLHATGWRAQYAGIAHAAGNGDTSWHGFALAIFEQAARHGVPTPAVAPIATGDWPTAAVRPPDSRLDCGRLQRLFGIALPHWTSGLRRTVDGILAADTPS